MRKDARGNYAAKDAAGGARNDPTLTQRSVSTRSVGTKKRREAGKRRARSDKRTMRVRDSGGGSHVDEAGTHKGTLFSGLRGERKKKEAYSGRDSAPEALRELRVASLHFVDADVAVERENGARSFWKKRLFTPCHRFPRLNTKRTNSRAGANAATQNSYPHNLVATTCGSVDDREYMRREPLQGHRLFGNLRGFRRVLR